MIVPMDSQELARQIADATRLGAEEEHARIVEQLSDAAKLQAAAGDIDGAQILAEAVRLLTPPLQDETTVTAEVELPFGITEKAEITMKELPPVRVTSDDEDAFAAQRALSHRPREL